MGVAIFYLDQVNPQIWHLILLYKLLFYAGIYGDARGALVDEK